MRSVPEGNDEMVIPRGSASSFSLSHRSDPSSVTVRAVDLCELNLTPIPSYSPSNHFDLTEYAFKVSYEVRVVLVGPSPVPPVRYTRAIGVEVADPSIDPLKGIPCGDCEVS